MLVTFRDYTPIPRTDNLPWTQVRIEEGPTADGPWTVIDTQTLSPIDVDPTHPMTRLFSTDLATLENGWYQVFFLDGIGTVLPTDPVQNEGVTPHPYIASLTDIGSVIMSRTKDNFGNVTGTFGSNTTPNNVQASDAAQDAARDVSIEIGDDVPDALLDDARRLVAIKAAMDIELAFYSDQVNTGRSIYPQLERQYEAGLLRLQRAITLYSEDGGTVASEGGGGSPSYSFPSSDNLLTRRM